MKLSIAEKSSLVLVIADLISGAKVTAGGRVSFDRDKSSRDAIREQIGLDIESKISDVCGEQGLIDFLRFQLMRQVLGVGLKGAKYQLADLDGFGDTLAKARSLVADLERLPAKFRIVSPLPHSYSGYLFNGINRLSLGDGIAIERVENVWQSIDLSFKSERLQAAILRNVDLEDFPKTSLHCICTWHSGFAGAFSGNLSMQAHQDVVRSFHGALLSLGVLSEDFLFDTLKQFSVIATDISKAPVGEVVLAANVDTDLSMFYKNFDTDLDYYQSPQDAEEISDDPVEEGYGGSSVVSWNPLDEETSRRRDEFLYNIKSVFGKDDNSRKLRTSALWLFRSFVSSRSLDVILESTIALEVLLGDRNESSGIGLTKLLANRCAYLLGQSASDRISVMEEFKSIYEMRSGIVHGGLHQMDAKATKTSFLARDLAGRVLRKEIELASPVATG